MTAIQKALYAMLLIVVFCILSAILFHTLPIVIGLLAHTIPTDDKDILFAIPACALSIYAIFLMLVLGRT
jgi:hypothetical protein